MLDSPHSGQEYPRGFDCEATASDLLTAWDAYVDDLWSGAVACGASLLAARFPRVVVDVNRDSVDIEPELLAGPWPSEWGELLPTSYSDRGMGLIRRLILPDRPMYRNPLSVAEVKGRIDTLYRPYHAALEQRLDSLLQRFGRVWHINCHSMKSQANAMNLDAGRERPDFVVSDARRTTSSPDFGDFIEAELRAMGYTTARNDPYQGGFIVRRFGRPRDGVNSIQIEINRRLYLDESRAVPSEGYAQLQESLSLLCRRVCEHIRRGLDVQRS